MTKKREKEEAAETEEAALDHLKQPKTIPSHSKQEPKEFVTPESQRNGISMMTVFDLSWICTWPI